ncbi:MAG: ABC transporter permease [Mailhella sp.]|nr:ABC transporter permease [Mailhella sp.]
MRLPSFSFRRWWGIVIKEFLQLKRDRITFGMIVGIPVVQLFLFGYAINNDPKHIPTVLIRAEQSEFSRTVGSALMNSLYFDVMPALDKASADKLMLQGKAGFIVTIPQDFTARMIRGEKPSILIEADASDPTSVSGALGALQGIMRSVCQKVFSGPLSFLKAAEPNVSFTVHKRYNPDGLTSYNIVPSLIGIILSLTMVMMTGLAVTREREQGTMENLLASPVTPFEILSGKIIPYIVIGHIQIGLIIVLSMVLFSVPFTGSPSALYAACLLFILASLIVGITVSTAAKNQMQAMQMSFFYFLPNIMLSGFMFPFAGMPGWAQAIGGLLPLTYFNRIVRAVFLKGAGWGDLLPNLWPIALFCIVFLGLAVKLFRSTLD